MKINYIKIECNLIVSSFCDGSSSQTIHGLYPTVAAGYKIVEVTRHLVFCSFNITSINKVNIVLKIIKIHIKSNNHNHRKLINLRGELIIIHLQIMQGYDARV